MLVRVDRRTALGAFTRALLVPAAALGVHQLRYLLAYGGGAGPQLQATGHSYLHSLVPWIVLLVGVSAGGLLWALGRALSGHRSVSRFSLSFGALWLVCATCLIAIFAAQELLEGLFVTGHPAGLAGIFGYGGWWAIPVASCAGMVLAAVFHGARWALDAVARLRGRRLVASRRARAVPRLAGAIVLRPAPLVAGWSGRGPPAP